MKRFAFVNCIAISLVVLMSISAVFAQNAKVQWWPGERPTPSASGSLSGVVTGVTSTTLTVRTEKYGSPIFTLNPDTKVMGKKTSIGDVRIGDKVVVSYTTLVDDNVWAKVVNVRGDEPEPGNKYGSVFGHVSAVNQTSIAIVTEDNTQQSFGLTPQTEVKVRGVKSTIDQVKNGDPAIIAFTKTSDGQVARGIRVLAEGIWPHLSGIVFGKVITINTSSITVQTEKNGDQTLPITDNTQFLVYGEKATIDQIKPGDKVGVNYSVLDDGTKVTRSVAIQIPVFRGKVVSVGNDGFVITDKTQSIPVAVTPQTKITTHTYTGTLADVMAGYYVMVRGIPSGNSVRAIDVGLSVPEAKGVVVSASGNTIVVQAMRRTVNVTGFSGTAILVRPKNAPNFPGTPADVKPGTAIIVGGHRTGENAMTALWIDLLVP